jgi:4-hydroxythreonine-4-phosphate dehydrogenase
MRLAITCGDPAGVGPEIIARLLRMGAELDVELTIFGAAKWLMTLPATRGVTFAPVGDEAFRAVAGNPTDEGAAIALAAMEVAAAGCRDGRFDAVVTGPVSKSALQKIGYPFPGQSEFFAVRWGGEPTMAFTGGKLRVLLATWHIPLREVPAQLTRAALERTVRHADWLARAEGCAAPRIAVCGLNPHAGEDGVLGREEIEWLNPWLDALRPQHAGLSPCLPGDTVFARMLRDEFDVIVSPYHDQGLAPLKVVDFDTAVNCTLGLPFIRTSPDHGTAFAIAGKGVASSTSFANAVRVAARLARYRAAHPF